MHFLYDLETYTKIKYLHDERNENFNNVFTFCKPFPCEINLLMNNMQNFYKSRIQLHLMKKVTFIITSAVCYDRRCLGLFSKPIKIIKRGGNQTQVE